MPSRIARVLSSRETINRRVLVIVSPALRNAYPSAQVSTTLPQSPDAIASKPF